MLKLKIYKFIGKFIPYFNLKFHKMSFSSIISKVSTSLNNIGYNEICQTIITDDKSNREYKIIFDINLNHKPYGLKFHIYYKNNNLDFKYLQYLPLLHSAWESIDDINQVNKELNDIDKELNKIKNDLSKIFSIM